MDEHELDYYEKLADRHQEFLEELELHKKEFEDRHDPVEDMIFNDEEDETGEHGYSVYDYWFDKQLMEFESYMEWLKHEVYLDRINTPYEEAADRYYEEREAFEAAIEASPHDPMNKLLLSMKEAEQFGYENDKSFAYEGLNIISQEAAEDNFGDGDPSQWNY